VTREELLLAIARYGLHPPSHPIIERPLSGQAWNWLAPQLERDLLVAVALDAAARGLLPFTNEQREDLSRRLAAAAARRSAADDCLDEAVAVLDEHDIASCVLHDAANAELDYDEPALRLYDSVHLLLAPSLRKRGVAALMEHGVLRPDPDSTRRKKRLPRTYLSQDGINVVVYTSIVPREFGASVELNELSPHRVVYRPRAVTFRALAAEERLLAAAIRSRLGAVRRTVLTERDLVRLVLREGLSVGRVERLATAWRLEALLAEAVRRAWEYLKIPDVVPISTWSTSYRPPRRERRRLAAHPLRGFGV
jgi:hypothetical protein